jgi:hypothetical protein
MTKPQPRPAKRTLHANGPLGPLVGRFFHTTIECPHGRRVAEWQGHIIAAVSDDVLLIELFEWLMGEPNGQEFITLADFMAKKPVLYSTGDEMRFSYEHGHLLHSSRCIHESPTPTPQLEGNT